MFSNKWQKVKLTFLDPESEELWYKRTNKDVQYGRFRKVQGYLVDHKFLSDGVRDAIISILAGILDTEDEINLSMDIKSLLDNRFGGSRVNHLASLYTALTVEEKAKFLEKINCRPNPQFTVDRETETEDTEGDVHLQQGSGLMETRKRMRRM